MPRYNWSIKRTKLYTTKGIRRVPCAKCGAPSAQQWNICAAGPYFRPVCDACDAALNALVLKWFGHPEADKLLAEYIGGGVSSATTDTRTNQ